MRIGLLVSMPLCLLLIGIPMFFGVAIGNVVLTVIAAIKTNAGECYRYPLALRLVR